MEEREGEEGEAKRRRLVGTQLDYVVAAADRTLAEATVEGEEAEAAVGRLCTTCAKDQLGDWRTTGR